MNDNCLLKNRSLRRAHQTRWSGQIFPPGFNKSPYYSQTFASHYLFTNNHTFPSIFMSKIYNLQELPSSWHVHEIWPIQGLIFTFQYFIPNLFDVRYVFTSSCLQECSCLVYVICVCLHIVMSITYCVVFLRLVYPMFPISLDSTFLIAPSVFSNVYLLIASFLRSLGSTLYCER